MNVLVWGKVQNILNVDSGLFFPTKFCFETASSFYLVISTLLGSNVGVVGGREVGRKEGRKEATLKSRIE